MKLNVIFGLILALFIQPAAAQEADTTIEGMPEKAVAVEVRNDTAEDLFVSADVAALEALQQQDFDFKAKDGAGNPPLYYLLTRHADLETVKKAIELGADVNMPAANGMLPLNILTSKANELQLQIMMMKTMGLDVNDPKIQEKLKEKLFQEMNNMIALTQLLIANGADVNQESVLGTPLMNAVTNAWNLDIVDLLIKAGADVNKTDKDGKTALFYAASGGNDEIITLLIKSGADTDVKDRQGRTYLEVERLDVGDVL